MVDVTNLVMDFGATFRRQLHFISPWDLTGCTVLLSVLSRRSNPITYELPVDLTASTVDLHFSPVQTMQLKRLRNHTYYIDVFYPSGDAVRVITGKIKSNV
jgi:hypothetical protein